MHLIPIITLRAAQAALIVTFYLTAPKMAAAAIAWGGTVLGQATSW
jgi:hypothetical protein